MRLGPCGPCGLSTAEHRERLYPWALLICRGRPFLVIQLRAVDSLSCPVRQSPAGCCTIPFQAPRSSQRGSAIARGNRGTPASAC